MHGFDDVAAVEAWLNQSESREATGNYDNLRLDPLREVLQQLPSPPRPITLAGTKGKGSTQRMLEVILLAHGAHTVAFTSPHVNSITERWRVDGDKVRAADLAGAASRIAQCQQQEHLTYFERCFAIAVAIASSRSQSFFIVEVGLGGRLDCANVLSTQLAIISHLGYDHCAVLGDTLTAIAGEKLAIGRDDAVMLIGPQDDEAEAAVHHHNPAAERIERPAALSADIALGLPGAHQRDNAGLAWRAAELLLPAFDHHLAQQALATVSLPARCQVITWRGRKLIIDSAHHDRSLAASIATAQDVFADHPWRLIIGCGTDKELSRMAHVLPSDLVIHRCGFDSPRARRADDWPAPWPNSPWHNDITAALASLEQAAAGTGALITGSFYLAGEALTVTANNQA